MLVSSALRGKTNLFFQFLLVFAFVLMILGTFANLEAIDEQQAGIHDENLPLHPVVDPMPFVEILPKPIDDKKLDSKAYAPRNGGPIGKRKMNKTQKVPPEREGEQIAAPENVSAREIDLSGAKLLPLPQPIGPRPSKETIPDQIKPVVKVEQKKASQKIFVKEENIEKPKAEENVVEPDRSANAKVDSGINKDAIQKEEQEIAIEAKEDKQKSLEQAKEILKEVKSELAKQNEETQKLVLDKIGKISEKVDKIEQLQKEEEQRDSASLRKQGENEAPAAAAEMHQNEINRNENNEDKRKNDNEKNENAVQMEVAKSIPDAAKVPEREIIKDPVVESILPKANAELKSNAENPGRLPSGEQIGRDLLSTKVEDDKPPKSRSKRNAELDEEFDDSDKVMWPKNAIRIKNTVHPKYTESKINALKEAFKGKFEAFKKKRDPKNQYIKTHLNRMFYSLDDNRFEKYEGLDDSPVYHARDLRSDEDKDAVVETEQIVEVKEDP